MKDVFKTKFTINSLDENRIFNEYRRFWSEYDKYRLRRKLKYRGIKYNIIPLTISFIVFLLVLSFITGSIIFSSVVTIIFVVPIGLTTFQIFDQTKFSKKYDEWLLRNISKSDSRYLRSLYKVILSKLSKMLPLEYHIEFTQEEIKIIITSSTKKQSYSHSFDVINFAYMSRDNLIFITKRNIKSLYMNNTARVPIVSPELRSELVYTLKNNNVSLFLEDHSE